MIFLLEGAIMRKLFTIALSILFSLAVFGAEMPPKPSTAVNDYAGILTQTEKDDLESLLDGYQKNSSVAIVVVIEQTLDGYSEFDRSYNIAKEWGVGQDGKDNGAVLYVAMRERKYWVQVGYGLEKSLPPSLVGSLLRQELRPYFKQGDYYTGIKNACSALIEATQGEYKAEEPKRKGFPVWMIVLFIILVLIITSIGRRGRGGYGTYGGGGYVGGFGGGGWSSGGGGGGFGGFGGGSFGGSGAGGSW